METILWHDYETFGANPAVDRPSQFAAIRTDFDLNIIGDPIQLYCIQSEDYLPHPDACLITGITPQDANREGYIEAEFISIINDEFSRSLTCVAGYNSIRFDDEVTRHTLYRNFYDPYAREWQNGNSRWDVIDMVRLVYAVRPESILWPKREDGAPSFRLEELTKINDIVHESAHDAMSDVYATIAIAKLVKDRCPELYELAFSMRDKKYVRSVLNIQEKIPVFHVSSKFSATIGCCAVVVPIAEHPVNKNAVICYDLRVDPIGLINLPPEEIRKRLFTSSAELEALGQERIPLKMVHVNKCPIVAPMSLTKSFSQAQLRKLKLDGDTLRNHLQKIRDASGLIEKIITVFAEGDTLSPSDIENPELALYTGGFFSHHDKQLMKKVTELSREQYSVFQPDFQDNRLPELYFRYKARNYPDQLTEDEHERWEQFRIKRLMGGDKNYLSFEAFFKRLQELSLRDGMSRRDAIILEDLKLYAESILPYG